MNWQPGQEVNKDVYAVNTGSIAAFVKETISGELNYDYEIMVEEFDPNTCVQITGTEARVIDGATKEEAGGFLVWTNAKDATDPTKPAITPGPVNSARNDDVDETETGENDPGVADPKWTPPASGDYIFRRSVINTGTEGSDPTWTYTYAGYHFEKGNGLDEDDPDYVPDRYYKIVIGNDSFRAASETPGTPNEIEFDNSVAGTGANGLGVEIDADGIPQTDPTIHYVELREVKGVKPNLTFHGADSDNPAYLQVSYTDNQEDTAVSSALLDAYNAAKAAYNAAVAAAATDDATVAQKEVEYQDALGAYNTALSRYNQTKADYDYAAALTEATNDLIDAADERKSVEAAKDAAEERLEQAAADLKQAAQDLKDGNEWLYKMQSDNEAAADERTNSAIGTYTLIPATDRARIEAYNETYGGLGNVISNLALFDAKYDEIAGYADAICDALDELAAIQTGDASTYFDAATDAYTTSARVAELMEIIEDNKADLEDAIVVYKNLYADIHRSVVAEDNLTGLNIGTSTAIADFITANVDTFDTDDLNDAADEYKEAYDDYESYVEDGGLIDQADEAWAGAVEAYNEAVTGDKATYDAAIAAEQPKPNYYAPDYLNDSDEVTDTGYLIDNSATLVPYNGTSKTAGYSANFDPTVTDDSADPTIADNAAWKDYTTDATYSSKPINGTSLTATGTHNAAIVKQSVEDEATFDQLAASIYPASENGNLGALLEAKNGAAGDLADALEAYNTAKENRTGRQDIIDDAEQAMNDAQDAYNDSVAGSSQIDIRINLADTYADLGWTFDGADEDTVTEAEFYLNKILEAGETSTKLIDSVYLADTTTTADYKNLQFDLNVGLDSIQVTYDANQRDYTADAVNADDGFALTATVDTTDNSVTWG